MSFLKEAERKRQLEAMLKPGVIKPLSSPWASSVILALKKEGSLIFYINFYKLNEVNEVTVRDSYPLQRMDYIFDIL